MKVSEIKYQIKALELEKEKAAYRVEEWRDKYWKAKTKDEREVYRIYLDKWTVIEDQVRNNIFDLITKLHEKGLFKK